MNHGSHITQFLMAMFDIGRPSGLNVLVSWREHCEIINNFNQKLINAGKEF
jgi:hypothetical protein